MNENLEMLGFCHIFYPIASGFHGDKNQGSSMWEVQEDCSHPGSLSTVP